MAFAQANPNRRPITISTAEAFDAAVNSKTSGKSLWQLYQEMSFGQLYPIGFVRPAVGSTTRAFDLTYNHKFSTITPGGLCTGQSLAPLITNDWAAPFRATRLRDGGLPVPLALLGAADAFAYPTFRSYLDAIARARPAVNVAARLEALCKGFGCEAVIIPHNSNLSDGQQFFDPATKQWETVGPAPVGARSGASVVPLLMTAPYDTMKLLTFGGVPFTVIGILVIFAIFAPLIAPHNSILRPPTWEERLALRKE